jgi:RNase H-fold protein (predicted Holliday junction resolvase)
MPDETARPLILAIDPGREKCGLALVDGRSHLRLRAVVPTGSVAARVAEWCAAHAPDHILLGAGTGSSPLRATLVARAIPVEIVPERDTTLRARALYFADHPPRGLRRLLPRSLLTPPIPIDDYAACAIALAWLAATDGVTR